MTATEARGYIKGMEQEARNVVMRGMIIVKSLFEAEADIEALEDDRDDLSHEIHVLKRHIDAMEIGRRNENWIEKAIEERADEKDKRIDQLERALCEAQDKLRTEIAEHQTAREHVKALRIDLAAHQNENKKLRQRLREIRDQTTL